MMAPEAAYTSRTRLLKRSWRIDWIEEEQAFWDTFQKTQNQEWEEISRTGHCGISFGNLHEYQNWRCDRWRAKNNLFYLAVDILNFKDMALLHLDVADWRKRTQDTYMRMLCLPRGHFKTTENVICGATQDVINDPNIRIAIVTGDLDLGRVMIADPTRLAA